MTVLPRFEQTRLAREHAQAVTDGRLTLQQCRQCGALQYPYRELCSACLADALHWTVVDGHGTVTAAVRVHASTHTFFRDNGPWRVCSVALDVGPRVIAHLMGGETGSGDRVNVIDERVDSSYSVLVARREFVSS